MKKILFLFLMVFLGIATGTQAASVSINATNFPDENFRNWILAQSYGADGILTDAEIAEVTWINVENNSISDLTGIGFFTALKLLSCSYNQLTALDFSKNTALIMLACIDNQLTALNVSKNTALKELYCDYNQLTALDVSKNTELKELYCYNNQLIALDVSKNTALNMLDCSYNQLTSLDVSKNTALEYLVCYSNQLTSLDVSENTALKWLGCGYNQLTSLDVSKNTALEYLVCYNNQLTALDVSKNTALERLWCYENQLTALDVSKNTKLGDLNCSYNQLTALDVSKNTALHELWCYGNSIRGEAMQTLVNGLFDWSETSVGAIRLLVYRNETPTGNEMTTLQVAAAKAKNWKVQMSNDDGATWVDYPGVEPGIAINATNFPDENFRNWILAQDYGADGILADAEIAAVKTIDVSSKSISNLKGIEHFTALEALSCYDNQLTSLDVSKNTALEVLECDYNQLTSLDVSKNTALESLNCYYNQLTSLDVSKNTALKWLECYSNQLTSLDVSKNTALEELQCSDNQLTSLDVSENTKLYSLFCDRNQLTSLDISKNTALEELQCSDNQLTSLDVSENTKLYSLFCYENQLPTLDVSKNTALKYLYCYSNRLTALDVSKNTALQYLYCYGNSIRGEAMQTFVNGLCDMSWSPEQRTLCVYWDETATGNEMTTLQVAAAKAKNWQVLMWDGNNWVDYQGVDPVIVTLNKSEVVVRKNKSVTLKATVSPETLADKSVKWKSSNTKIATVSSSGKVTGVKTGTVTITCTSVATGAKATCKVTVGTITLDKKDVIVRKKKAVTLTPTVYPTSLADKSVKWKSSDETIATVSSKGVVKGIKSGVVTITCTSVATDLSTTCTVTVGTITLNKSSVTIQKGKTLTLKPTVYPTTLEDKSVTWKSSDKAIATVSSSGKVKGVKSGTAVITCTSVATGLSTTCTVTVGTVILNLSEIAINKGKSVTLEPDVYPTTLTDQSVTWKCSDETVATVSSDGKVTGIAAGTATVTCTSVATGLSTTCKVTVTDFTPARILLGDDADVTGIETVEEAPAVEEPFDVYDLKGHRVLQRVTSLDGLPAGVYIVNGKKMLKK